MQATITRIWCSPTTLHVRLMIHGVGGRWYKSVEIHCPLSTIDRRTRERITDAADDLNPECLDRPLW